MAASDARTEILARLHTALGIDRAGPGEPPSASEVPRVYRVAGTLTAQARAELFVDRLTDYRATVSQCSTTDLADTIAAALADVPRLLVPADLPSGWLGAYSGADVRDDNSTPCDLATLDGVDAVLTGCAVAIAPTGTIILDGGLTQGRRALTLVPDRHICVIHVEQLEESLAEALQTLDPHRPLTFISGPSATSDIELNRVEGVHGPRHLHIILTQSTDS
ncbi:MAG: LutC/YkgG family protein [Jiangellaceae bacterium]